MKNFLKKSVLWILAKLVRFKLKRLKPHIIGITGSVGKTSGKLAIHEVLKGHFSTYCSHRNYNTEFGLMLAILEQESGGSSPVKWLKSLFGGLIKALFSPAHHKKLVLEYGADKPGDIEYLVKIVPPQIAVLTQIAESHLSDQQFKDQTAIWEEKKRLIEALPKNGWAILNLGDPFQQKLTGVETTFQKLFYGLTPKADLFADQIESGEFGLRFRVHYQGENALAEVPILGEHHLGILLAAIAVGVISGLDLKIAAAALSHFQLPRGRLNLIEGINGSKIIDSSYNASPASMKAALKVLRSLNGERYIAVLGDMNELGGRSEKLHRQIGQLVPKYADLLITVGEKSHAIASAARQKGLSEVHSFGHAKEAAEFLVKKLQPDDVVLVKGSQNLVRLETLIQAIMAYPEKASEVLVRQEKEWRKK